MKRAMDLFEMHVGKREDPEAMMVRLLSVEEKGLLFMKQHKEVTDRLKSSRKELIKRVKTDRGETEYIIIPIPPSKAIATTHIEAPTPSAEAHARLRCTPSSRCSADGAPASCVSGCQSRLCCRLLESARATMSAPGPRRAGAG